MQRAIAYYRVSTQRQGQSGLGLDAQQQAVHSFINGRYELLNEYTEIESGKNINREQLNAALKECKLTNSILVIAKLDRLARNVNFVSGLMTAGVEFIAVDMPMANKLTIHILAAVAEHERDLISQRTKAALAVAKGRGIKLGNPNLHNNNDKAVEAHKKAANSFAQTIAPIFKEIESAGVQGLRGFAKALNARGILTQTGKEWTPTGVKNIIHRLQQHQAMP